ncbi:hypothetical protein MJO28_003256, partial [Puccinia striiformis f. sp. tritici]
VLFLSADSERASGDSSKLVTGDFSRFFDFIQMSFNGQDRIRLISLSLKYHKIS